MIETNWSPEFQHLILAAALRGDLLRQIPLDPELFRPRDKGPKPPEQRVAELAVKFYEKYKTKPTLAEFDQLLAEARFGPERVPEIADVMAAVRAAPVPEDLTSILDTVRDQIEKRRIEKALFESAPELDKPDGAERARDRHKDSNIGLNTPLVLTELRQPRIAPLSRVLRFPHDRSTFLTIVRMHALKHVRATAPFAERLDII